MIVTGYSRTHRTCTGKIGHSTRAGAQKAIRHTKRVTGDKGRLVVYLCQYCHLFHAGHVKAQEGHNDGTFSSGR